MAKQTFKEFLENQGFKLGSNAGFKRFEVPKDFFNTTPIRTTPKPIIQPISEPIQSNLQYTPNPAQSVSQPIQSTVPFQSAIPQTQVPQRGIVSKVVGRMAEGKELEAGYNVVKNIFKVPGAIGGGLIGGLVNYVGEATKQSKDLLLGKTTFKKAQKSIWDSTIKGAKDTAKFGGDLTASAPDLPFAPIYMLVGAGKGIANTFSETGTLYEKYKQEGNKNPGVYATYGNVIKGSEEGWKLLGIDGQTAKKLSQKNPILGGIGNFLLYGTAAAGALGLAKQVNFGVSLAKQKTPTGNRVLMSEDTYNSIKGDPNFKETLNNSKVEIIKISDGSNKIAITLDDLKKLKLQDTDILINDSTKPPPGFLELKEWKRTLAGTLTSDIKNGKLTTPKYSYGGEVSPRLSTPPEQTQIVDQQKIPKSSVDRAINDVASKVDRLFDTKNPYSPAKSKAGDIIRELQKTSTDMDSPGQFYTKVASKIKELNLTPEQQAVILGKEAGLAGTVQDFFLQLKVDEATYRGMATKGMEGGYVARPEVPTPKVSTPATPGVSQVLTPPLGFRVTESTKLKGVDNILSKLKDSLAKKDSLISKSNPTAKDLNDVKLLRSMIANLENTVSTAQRNTTVAQEPTESSVSQPRATQPATTNATPQARTQNVAINQEQPITTTGGTKIPQVEPVTQQESVVQPLATNQWLIDETNTSTLKPMGNKFVVTLSKTNGKATFKKYSLSPTGERKLVYQIPADKAYGTFRSKDPGTIARKIVNQTPTIQKIQPEYKSAQTKAIERGLPTKTPGGIPIEYREKVEKRPMGRPKKEVTEADLERAGLRRKAFLKLEADTKEAARRNKLVELEKAKKELENARVKHAEETLAELKRTSASEVVTRKLSPEEANKPVGSHFISKEKLKAPSGKGQADIGIFSEDTPVLEGGKIKPIQTPEMIQLVKELTGNIPKLNARLRTARGKFFGRGTGEIQLKPEIFKDPIQAAKTLAHEIGHLTDWLPKMGIKRTSLLQKLYILKNHLHTEFGTELIKNKDIKEELWDLSTYWRPLGNYPTSGFLKYRKSANELYADAISALFNSPGIVEEKAPLFYKAFFSSLDQKPTINEKYWELQDLLFGAKEEVFKARENRIKQGFEKAYDIQKGFEAKKDKADKRLFERLRQQLDDRYHPISKKVQEAESKGLIINDSENPKYILSELAYINNDNYLLVDKLDKEVSKPIKDAGMNDEDLGIYLLLDRIQGGRQEVANPYGFDINTAPEQLNYLKERVGEDKFKLLQEKVKLFHDIVFKSVEKAVKVGSYNKELFETTIKPNKENYATFSVVDYLQDYVPATIKKQIGTLKEVANPYQSTILKTLALNKLNAIQEAKNATIKLLQDQFPTEITKSREIKTGKITIYPKTNSQLQVLEDGKLKSYEVDPYISKSFEVDDPDDLNASIKLLGNVNQSFKSLVTTYNLGFSLAFNPIRDFRRNYKLIPDATIGGLIKSYVKSFPSAVRYAKGNLDDVTRQMVEDKIINVPINDYNFDPRDDEMGRILEKYGVLGKSELKTNANHARRFVYAPLAKTLEAMRFVANTFEIVSKIAGTKIRVASGETGKGLAYNVRTYTGTPNWKVKGLHTKTTNEIFVFSNIMKEGIKSDFIIATSPKTRSGYWWKTVKIDLMPKLLMFLAGVGLFGPKLKNLFDGETEYDKTNYITIPVGERNGKTVYFRIPHDETGRLVSAIFWKALNYVKDRNASDLQDIFSFGAGQIPQVTPVVTFLSTWGQFLSGKNPYDKFRGRLLMDDTTFQAGGMPALKKMVQWSANTMGLSQFTTYDPNKGDTIETLVQMLPVINRLLKISDYGRTESDQKLQGEVKTERAKELIKEKEVISKYVNKNKADYKTGIINIDKIGDEVVKEILGHYPKTDEEDARDVSIRKRLKTSMIVGAYGSRVDSLVYANSNKEKVALLNKYKSEMSEDQFYEFTNLLLNEGVISDNVYDEIPKKTLNSNTTKDQQALDDFLNN